MTRALLVLVAISTFSFVGCEEKKASVVVDKSEIDQYRIPPGELEKAMKEAASGAAAKAKSK
ncbi:hypothetical protein [Rubripirellula reticaptiva]|uniref:Uncharacterized protein n=1 Tax=Rubripirellula reticaptiva TaxID=2528013 RepID=A0A5C6EIL8_9BACT|nr:hypothetical protein [Rubripirellula reticaptiva]TWU48330.1 hypothetical protein Poly59_51760 [Rubripirellula reticaptiva]